MNSLGERVAVLETKFERLETMEKKLDELLELKSKGLGALGLVSILIGSGVLGVIAMLFQLFRTTPHV